MLCHKWFVEYKSSKNDMLRDEELENFYYLVNIPTKTVDLYFHPGHASHSEVKILFISVVTM